jgi:hypothetical protein
MTEQAQFETVDLRATYLRGAGSKRALIQDGTECYRVEEFAARHFNRSGFNTSFLESTPFVVLFAVYMCSLIQDPCDPLVRMVAFGDRHKYDQQHLPSELMWTELPEDFGSASYGRRRVKPIAKHLSAIIEDKAELRHLFDRWLAQSLGLRQYLWAHREESIETARTLIEIIPPHTIKTLLSYLIEDFWGRHSGWPRLASVPRK